MKFKKGDKVSVLDEDISGVVLKTSDAQVSIETPDGFVFEFPASELIKIDASIQSELFSTQSASAVIQEKEQQQRRKLPKIKPKERNNPAMEVDLHIHKLTDHDSRMTSHEKLTLQLDTAQRQLEFAIKKRIQKIVFIHGVGEGVLKMELETLFRRYDNIKFYDADYKKYGLGATEVYIYQNVN